MNKPSQLQQKGAVVSVAIDFGARRAFFGHDGEWKEVPRRLSDQLFAASGTTLYLVVSGLACGGEVRLNLGDREWAHPDAPPGGIFKPIMQAASGDTPVLAAAALGHTRVASLLLARVWAATEQAAPAPASGGGR